VDLIDSISIRGSRTLPAGKTLHPKRKTRHKDRVFSLIEENLAMAMMAVMTTMMGCGICRNH
jgi:hypothetical protein